MPSIFALPICIPPGAGGTLMRHRLTLCAVTQPRHFPTLVLPTRRGFRATLIALPAERSSSQFIRRRGQAASVARGRNRTGLTDCAVTAPRQPLHMSRHFAHRRNRIYGWRGVPRSIWSQARELNPGCAACNHRMTRSARQVNTRSRAPAYGAGGRNRTAQNLKGRRSSWKS